MEAGGKGKAQQWQIFAEIAVQSLALIGGGRVGAAGAANGSPPFQPSPYTAFTLYIVTKLFLDFTLITIS